MIGVGSEFHSVGERRMSERTNLHPVPRIFRVFFNIIGLPGHRNKRESVLEITKMYNYKIIEH